MLLADDRAFDLAYGTLTGGACLMLALPLLWWWMPRHRRSAFGTRIDPAYRLQLAYGLFTMAMAGTNFFCRYIPHGRLAYVHPAFAIITLMLVAGLTPRVMALRAVSRRRRSVRAA